MQDSPLTAIAHRARCRQAVLGPALRPLRRAAGAARRPRHDACRFARRRAAESIAAVAAARLVQGLAHVERRGDRALDRARPARARAGGAPLRAHHDRLQHRADRRAAHRRAARSPAELAGGVLDAWRRRRAARRGRPAAACARPRPSRAALDPPGGARVAASPRSSRERRFVAPLLVVLCLRRSASSPGCRTRPSRWSAARRSDRLRMAGCSPASCSDRSAAPGRRAVWCCSLGHARLLRAGARLDARGGATAAALAWAGVAHWRAVVAPFASCFSAPRSSLPNATALALSPFPAPRARASLADRRDRLHRRRARQHPARRSFRRHARARWRAPPRSPDWRRSASKGCCADVERVDAVVIGAGVVGLAVARELALAGREVVILEAEDAIGTHTSSRNSEVIHAGIYYPKGSLKARACVEGKAAALRVLRGARRAAPALRQADRRHQRAAAGGAGRHPGEGARQRRHRRRLDRAGRGRAPRARALLRGRAAIRPRPASSTATR